MNWKIGEAKQRFSEVVRATEEGPQRIYNRDRLVAAVVAPEDLEEFLSWRERRQVPLLSALGELNRVCSEEGYSLDLPDREDRHNPFAEDLDVPL